MKKLKMMMNFKISNFLIMNKIQQPIFLFQVKRLKHHHLERGNHRQFIVGGSRLSLYNHIQFHEIKN
jgi:hypothetical protein